VEDTYLHIVSFTIPYPANYGGVIDVFYKLKALKAAGVKTILHCFSYDRTHSEELNDWCYKLYYYPRNTSVFTAFHYRPYIVNSRLSDALLNNLLKDDHPILFEGMHSCFFISHPLLQKRKKIYRESNIEHIYYYYLFKAEKNAIKKLFLITESIKLRLYQKTLRHACLMLAVSENDTMYLRKKFPGSQVEHLPSFHPNEQFNNIPGKGKYVLYHGNLTVSENYRAVTFLIKNVFANTSIPFIVAGLNPPEFLQKLAARHSNVQMVANPTDETMFTLIKDAHINILITFQATGLKLKLLNTLYNGRFVLVNAAMISGTGLSSLCYLAETGAQMLEKLEILFAKEFDNSEIAKREKLLGAKYSNEKNAGRLIGWVYR